MEQQALITMYLADETKLYQDWFAIYNSQTAEQQSLESLKKRFNIWFDSQKKALQNIICNELGDEFTDKITLIKTIATDYLQVTYDFSADSTLIISTILVIDGYLEILCPKNRIIS
ncbi:MAG: hypothetical protein QM487_00190 [Candidatus Marithrix sp.]